MLGAGERFAIGTNKGWQMFRLQMFEVFHDGYRYGKPPPTFYLIVPAQNDSYEIAQWKIKELELPTREEKLGTGIPYVGVSVEHSILITSYIKQEIKNFLFAIGAEVAFWERNRSNSIELFRPRPSYTESPLYQHYMPRVQRSVNLRNSSLAQGVLSLFR
jgi:hypothetical protein